MAGMDCGNPCSAPQYLKLDSSAQRKIFQRGFIGDNPIRQYRAFLSHTMPLRPFQRPLFLHIFYKFSQSRLAALKNSN